MLLSMARILNKYIVWDIMYIIDEYVPGTPCTDNECKNGKVMICSAHNGTKCVSCYCNICVCHPYNKCSICGCSVCYHCSDATNCGHEIICKDCTRDTSQCGNYCELKYCSACVDKFKICDDCKSHYCYNCFDNFKTCINCKNYCCNNCIDADYMGLSSLCYTCHEDKTFYCTSCDKLSFENNEWYADDNKCFNCCEKFCTICITKIKGEVYCDNCIINAVYF